MDVDIRGLSERRCIPCEGGSEPLGMEEIQAYLAYLPGWQHQGGYISRLFEFKNFYQTMAFVNAVAWIAHREDHHPELEVKYRSCMVRYSTHAIGGLSENDFICAAKIDGLVGNGPGK